MLKTSNVKSTSKSGVEENSPSQLDVNFASPVGNWWDPTAEKNVYAVSRAVASLSTSGSGTAPFLLRIKRDMMSIYQDPPPGILCMQDDHDMTLIHALITGSFDTPYEGGFFYFIVRCPPNYPIEPPHVKFMTTCGGTVRFNPNLYKCGKVCISILGTWSGPAWTPALTLSSVLISIQSLLTENPYHNEPGFEREKANGDSQRYNEIIQHETIRVAVIGMIENDCGLCIPEPLMDAMRQSFTQFYDYYESTLLSKVHFSGCAMQDPFGEERGVFNYQGLLDRLRALRRKLCQPPEEGASSSSSSVSPTSEEG
ncbi:Ubiquitin-conjugating enzyme E2Z [Nesidiocoris tenuis]|uniref:Ubiquitin-conjugating enzyme E2 Z n=1 Tax=Nesidiocoris tenuis TaxID=355587 RepID=A0ABN7AUD0_9HEMI|nr:Ubiquitin-conjugating enzyme E2Z [Nesidiocoris tenuis]